MDLAFSVSRTCRLKVIYTTVVEPATSLLTPLIPLEYLYGMSRRRMLRFRLTKKRKFSLFLFDKAKNR